MKKRMILTIITILTGYFHSYAAQDLSQRLLSLVQLKPQQATTTQITTILGQPNKTEENGRTHTWYYKTSTASLTLYWNGKNNRLEKYCFATTPDRKVAWDENKARFLKTGETELVQVLKQLGTPKDMTIKQMNQQVHYAFQDNVLNLFFRKGTLVNYTLF